MNPPAAGGYPDWSTAGWREHLPGVADPGGFTARLGEDTIPGLAAASAAAVPGRVAVTVDGVPVTHAQLDDAAARVAGWLARRVRPGDRVLIAAAASVGFVRCYLGALRAGAVVVLANPGYTAAELGHLVADSGAVLAFADPGPARVLAALGPEGAGLETVDIRTLPGDGSQAAGVAARPGDTALLAYTSGTTGRPKGVPLTHRRLAVSIRSAMAAWRWTGDDVLAHALPLYHQHGLGGVHAALIAGGTVHVRSRFSPADLARTIEDARASVLFAVPTIYQALADADLATARGFAGLRLAVCGSAPLSPGLAERLAAALGRVPLVRYGTTESGLNVSNPVDDPRGDTVGVPLPGVLARIAAAGGEGNPGAEGEGNPGAEGEGNPGAEGEGNPGAEGEGNPGAKGEGNPGAEGGAGPGSTREAGLGAEGGAGPGPVRAADLGTDGEIQLRGPQVFAGYWHDPAATAAAFTPDGWFRTGDIGAVDPATGHLRIRGRIKEMIITGGLNVYPREVELVLEAHPSVAEAAVAGVPHERWGEQVTAWVVVRDGHRFDEAALIAHARTRLAGYKCPKQVFRLAALPRNHVGKIVRSALA